MAQWLMFDDINGDMKFIGRYETFDETAEVSKRYNERGIPWGPVVAKVYVDFRNADRDYHPVFDKA